MRIMSFGSSTKRQKFGENPSHMTECINDFQALQEKMTQLAKDDHFNDVVIKIGRETLQANKALLSQASEYFRIMFEGPWKERETNEITLVEENEESGKFFADILHYIYTCQIKLTVDNVGHYLVLADKYMISDLVKPCRLYMKNAVGSPWDFVQHIYGWYVCARNVGDTEIENVCLDFMAHNLSVFVKNEYWHMFDFATIKTLLERDDLVVKSEYRLHDMLVSWFEHQELDESVDEDTSVTRKDDSIAENLQHESVTENIRKLLSLIRYTMLSQPEISQIMELEFVKNHPEVYEKEFILKAFVSHSKTGIPFRSNEKHVRPRNYTNAVVKFPAFVNQHSYAHKCTVSKSMISPKQDNHGIYDMFCTPSSMSTADLGKIFAWKLYVFPTGCDKSRTVRLKMQNSCSTALDMFYGESGKDTPSKLSGEADLMQRVASSSSPSASYLEVIMGRRFVSQKSGCIFGKVNHKLDYGHESWSLNVTLLIYCKKKGTRYVGKVLSKEITTNHGKGSFQFTNVFDPQLILSTDSEYIINGNMHMVIICKPTAITGWTDQEVKRRYEVY